MTRITTPRRSTSFTAVVSSAVFIASLYACMPETPAIELASPEILKGEPLGVTLTGLEPGSTVTLTAERPVMRDEALHLYRSEASFEVGPDGEVAPGKQAPFEGSWSESEAFGLLWSMRSVEGESVPEGWDPDDVRLAMDVEGDGVADATAHFTLTLNAEDVVDMPFDEDFPGAFVMAKPGDEPRPGIIVLGGSEGGDFAARGAAPRFAGRGYAVLGLPYYSPAYGNQTQQFPGLPKAFANIPIDRLEAAKAIFAARPDVRADSIAVYGVSKGAEMALMGASLMDGFAAVAGIVPSDVIWEGWGPGTQGGEEPSFSWRGEPLDFVPYEGMSEVIQKLQAGDEDARLTDAHEDGRAANPQAAERARIPVESIAAPVFVAGGREDDTWASGQMTETIIETRTEVGLPTRGFIFDEAGHYLGGLPTRPLPAVYGKARTQLYPALLDFFDDHLREEDKLG